VNRKCVYDEHISCTEGIPAERRQAVRDGRGPAAARGPITAVAGMIAGILPSTPSSAREGARGIGLRS